MEMTREQMQAEMERLKAETASLKKQLGRKVTVKVSAKGAVSIYGFGRFPLSIYGKNLKTLLSMKEELEQFMTNHEKELSWDKAETSSETVA